MDRAGGCLVSKVHPAGFRVTFHTNTLIKSCYNTFAMENISPIKDIATLLQTIGQPARLKILLAIGEGEACVCHLEATFGWRQAYLSQHLMALREAGLVTDRRESRFIFYQLTDLRIIGVLRQIAEMQGVELPELAPSPLCNCPNCDKQRHEACE